MTQVTNYSEQIVKILDLGKALAIEQKSNYVKAEHLLSVLVTSNDTLINQILNGFNGEKNTLLTLLTTSKVDRATHMEESQNGEIGYDADLKPIMEQARTEAHMRNENKVQPIHLFLAIAKSPSQVIKTALEKYGMNYENITEALQKLYASQGHSSTPFLDEYGTDLIAKARLGELDPVIGRYDEIERIMQILTRRKKNNPVLFGGPGVGKTAIVEGIARLISENKAPHALREKKIIELSIHSVIAGASARGEFEKRLKNIINEVKNSAGSIILFIDEIHTLVSEEDTDEAANILKPALARGEIQAIGATTEAEYRKYFEKDAALERRFQPVYIAEPSIEECLMILKGIKKRYETFHNVVIPDELLEDIIMLSDRYITNRLLPDKAIDLLDEACASLKLPEYSLPEEINANKEYLKYLTEKIQKTGEKKNLTTRLRQKQHKVIQKIQNLEKEYEEIKKQKTNIVNKIVIQSIVSQQTGIPLTHLKEEENERLIRIEDILKTKIVGQEQAIQSIANAIIRNRAGLNKKTRPIGSFIFMGPTGVGKTELAKTLAEYLFGTSDALVQFDMSEFMEKHAAAKLIGAPPGYIGYEEGGQLTEIIRTRPYSIILFDEIEKAHPEIFHLLLQILDEGHLTDSKGQKVNFKNTIIICTSNLGGQTINFAKYKSMDAREQKTTLVKELKKLLQPELINRFDDIILFNFLNKEDIRKIVDLLLMETRDALEEKNISLSLTDAAEQHLADIGYDPIFGARPLKYVIQKEIDNPLAKMLIQKEIKEDDQISCNYNGVNFEFRKLS